MTSDEEWDPSIYGDPVTLDEQLQLLSLLLYGTCDDTYCEEGNLVLAANLVGHNDDESDNEEICIVFDKDSVSTGALDDDDMLLSVSDLSVGTSGETINISDIMPNLYQSSRCNCLQKRYTSQPSPSCLPYTNEHN